MTDGDSPMRKRQELWCWECDVIARGSSHDFWRSIGRVSLYWTCDHEGGREGICSFLTHPTYQASCSMPLKQYIWMVRLIIKGVTLKVIKRLCELHWTGMKTRSVYYDLITRTQHSKNFLRVCSPPSPFPSPPRPPQMFPKCHFSEEKQDHYLWLSNPSAI